MAVGEGMSKDTLGLRKGAKWRIDCRRRGNTGPGESCRLKKSMFRSINE